MKKFDKYFKIFLAHYSLSILYSLFSPWSRPKIKIFWENLHFSQIFSKFFQSFINFNGCPWKITPNFRGLPKSKISFRPSKIGPPKHLVDASTEKSCINYCTVILISWKFLHFRSIMIKGLRSSDAILSRCRADKRFSIKYFKFFLVLKVVAKIFPKREVVHNSVPSFFNWNCFLVKIVSQKFGRG